MDIKKRKNELRAVYEEKQQQLSRGEVLRRSELICDYALALPALRDRKRIAAYSSFGHEVSTGPLLAGLLASGFLLTLPVVDKLAQKMEFRYVDNLNTLTPGVYGILEPQEGRLCPPEEIELFFIPGLAFDLKGNRLGRGGGYYDRYLSTVRPSAFKVGLAFQLQITDTLPVDPHDVKVDALITENGIVL